MIFDLLAPPQGPRGRGQKKCAVAHPIHVSNSHTKFGWISSNGLGGDSVTDGRTNRRTDRRTEAIAISPTLFLKKRGDNHISALNQKVIWISTAQLDKNSKHANLPTYQLTDTSDWAINFGGEK